MLTSFVQLPRQEPIALKQELQLLQELDNLVHYSTGSICFNGWSPTREGSKPETYDCHWYQTSKNEKTIYHPEKWQGITEAEKDTIIEQFNTATVMLYPYPYEHQDFIVSD